MIYRILILLILLIGTSGCYFPYDPENSDEYDKYWIDKEKNGQLEIKDPLKNEEAYQVSPGT